MTSGTRIGIVGSGDVGKALGRGLARHGFDVKVGSRTPGSDPLREWLAATQGKVSTGTFAEAAAHGEIVILATNGAATEAALDLAGPARFAGKLVIDATNPLDASRGMPPGLFVGTTDSLGERVQRKLPDAKVVKCFNTVPNSKMVDPRFSEPTPPMLIAGNDAEAKKRVESFLRDIGWPGVLDAGGIDGARWLEALVALWVRAGIASGNWGHVFKVVT